jgi:TonB family protein
MSADGPNPKKPDPADNYETAVLDFLDRELAAASPRGKTPQSDDVDDLVSSLLKQAITASDQQEANPETKSDELDSLLAGLLRSSGGDAAPAKHPATAAVAPAAAAVESRAAQGTPIPKPAAIPVEPAKAPAQTARPNTPARLGTATQAGPARGVPLLAWLAAGLLPAIGVAAYFLLGDKGSPPPAPQAAVAGSQLTPLPPAPVPAAATDGAAVSATTHAAAMDPPAPASYAAAPPKVHADAGASLAAQSVRAAMEAAPQLVPAMRSSPPERPRTVPASLPAPPPHSSGAPPSANPLEASQPSVTVVAQVAAPSSRPATSDLLALPARSGTTTPDLSTVRPRSGSGGGLQDVAQPIRQSPLIPAVLIQRVNPVYPPIALRTRVSGTVVVDLDINDRGNVARATPVAGPALLHNAALVAVMQWRYRPASQGGVNVPSRSRVEIKFENRER